MLIKCLSVLIWFVLVPFFMGLPVLKCLKKENTDAVSCVIAGYLLMFALFEVISVPMVLLRLRFHVLLRTVSAVFGVLALAALFRCRRTAVETAAAAVKAFFRQPWTLWAAWIFILIQISFYVFGMATDLDDAYYVAAAGTALETDTMFCVSPYTGSVVKQFQLRYILSPFPLMTAFFSKNCGFEVATMAHTILPVFLVGLAYMIYYKFGLLLFQKPGGELRETKKQAGLFLCFVSLVNINSYYSVYTQGTFLLIRIWQGKAVLAAVLLPFIFYMGYKAMSDHAEKGDWILLFLGMVSCCLVTSMGVVLAPVLLGIMALLLGVLKKKWTYVGRSLLCCLPCATVGILYIILNILR